ncbi:hypothetical protein J2S43_005861 [Catenuloplanes nepalensis]|uniref:FXSXX-COOH protein n=1 Tax=Catenuloplanes nepalensis TaxID=587533 RepID=A0ABT9N0W6_9ACTN|nr:hypothetical protein [Catenuloplanes nepalensis]MDP9797349.1 hypothetical protein [Catenuloplanes nepalensis]
MNIADAVPDVTVELCDVRSLPLDDLLTPAVPGLDDALEGVLRSMSSGSENLAAFGAAP